HSGAHQGGPIGSIPASAIPNGTITSAMIADGTITSADIADGTIATADIAPNAVQHLLGQYVAMTTFSTTTVGSWVTTPITLNSNSGGGTLRVEATVMISLSVAGAAVYAEFRLDAADSGQLAVVNVNANQVVTLAFQQYGGLSAGAHTITLCLMSQT